MVKLQPFRGRKIALLFALQVLFVTRASGDGPTMADSDTDATVGAGVGAASPTMVDDTTPHSDTNSNSKSNSVPIPPEDNDTFDAKDHKDWGTYYDPKNIFCGQYDCYKILGFDYESYGREKPTTKTITKRYRALSRERHPDKSKHKDAKERFVVRQLVTLLLEAAPVIDCRRWIGSLTRIAGGCL